jgi:hypothetical protein
MPGNSAMLPTSLRLRRIMFSIPGHPLTSNCWNLIRKSELSLSRRTCGLQSKTPTRDDLGHQIPQKRCNNTALSALANQVSSLDPLGKRTPSVKSVVPDSTDLLYIHRSYFAQALQQKPDNPLHHKYAASVMATYRAATRLIASLRSLYAVHQSPTGHCWYFWSGIFSSCVCISHCAWLCLGC